MLELNKIIMIYSVSKIVVGHTWTDLPLHCIFCGVIDQMKLERFAGSNATTVFQ